MTMTGPLCETVLRVFRNKMVARNADFWHDVRGGDPGRHGQSEDPVSPFGKSGGESVQGVAEHEGRRRSARRNPCRAAEATNISGERMTGAGRA